MPSPTRPFAPYRNPYGDTQKNCYGRKGDYIKYFSFHFCCALWGAGLNANGVAIRQTGSQLNMSAERSSL